MKVYDVTNGETYEYKYFITFGELLKREVDVTKKIYTTNSCISECNSTKAKADYIAINPLYEICCYSKHIIMIDNDAPQEKWSTIEKLPPLITCRNEMNLTQFNRNYDIESSRLPYNIFDTFDCLKHYVYLTNDINEYNKLVLDQNVSLKQSPIKLDNNQCKKIHELCKNEQTCSIGLELLANCYMTNLPLACVTIAYSTINLNKKKLSSKAQKLYCCLTTRQNERFNTNKYFIKLCIIFNQCNNEQCGILNRIFRTNTINEILDEWD